MCFPKIQSIGLTLSLRRRPAALRVAERVDERGPRKRLQGQGVWSGTVVEVAGNDDGRAVGRARLVGDDLGHLPLLQPLVVAALDVGVVEDDAPGARLEREATAAARLNRIDGPAPAILGLERQARGIVNDEPAEDRLAGERRRATASLAKLLELTRRHPVHVERGREIARDVPVSAPPAPLVHLLKQQNVGFESVEARRGPRRRPPRVRCSTSRH